MTIPIKPDNLEKYDYRYSRVESKYIYGNRIQREKKGDSGHQKKNYNRFCTIFAQFLEIITILKYQKAEFIWPVIDNLNIYSKKSLYRHSAKLKQNRFWTKFNFITPQNMYSICELNRNQNDIYRMY